MNEYEGMTSDEIKADIERKRGEMSQKLDTLQEKLHPENLKEQAQDMVQDAIRDGSDALTTYFNQNAPRMGSALAETIRRNPLPTALIGLGVGWLIMNSINSKPSGARRPARGRYPARWSSEAMDDMSLRYGGLGPYGYEEYGYEAWEESEGTYQSGEGRDQKGGLGRRIGEVRDAAQNVAGQVGERIGEIGERAGERIGELGERAGEMVEPAAQAGSQVRHQAGQIGHQVQDARQQAGEMMEQAQHRVQRTLDQNPVAFGAAALFTGMAIGLALPSTRQEGELMGSMRTRVVDKTQMMAANVAEEVKQTAAEVAPRIQEAAKRVVDDVAASTKEASDEVSQSLREATTTLRQKAESATGASQQETGTTSVSTAVG
jgi:F0F1-type ATP synthase membrane subunit b/b'